VIAVVLDTNILASGAIARVGTLSKIIDDWRAGIFTVIVSFPILDELERTLRKPYFADRLSTAQKEGFLLLLERQAELAGLTTEVHGVATHPEDDLIVSTAVSAKADYLVTGDRKLQSLRTFAGVTIVSPRDFFDRLEIERSRASADPQSNPVVE
jgi:putative PIN family toxin of toxin-antitoxin system